MADYETRRFSRAEYDKLIDLGLFRPGEAIELLGAAWYVRTQGPIGLDDESEPEPDVAVVPGGVEDYGRAHPSRVVLIVEVAETSLAVDREYKASLYARAGVPDYWILNLVDRMLEIYREPRADAAAPFGWSYGRSGIIGPRASVTPLEVSGSSVPVSQLLP